MYRYDFYALTLGKSQRRRDDGKEIMRRGGRSQRSHLPDLLYSPACLGGTSESSQEHSNNRTMGTPVTRITSGGCIFITFSYAYINLGRRFLPIALMKSFCATLEVKYRNVTNPLLPDGAFMSN